MYLCKNLVPTAFYIVSNVSNDVKYCKIKTIKFGIK